MVVDIIGFLVDYALAANKGLASNVFPDLINNLSVTVVVLFELSQILQELSVHLIEVLQFQHLFLASILICDLMLKVIVLDLELDHFETDLFLIDHFFKREMHSMVILPTTLSFLA